MICEACDKYNEEVGIYCFHCGSTLQPSATNPIGATCHIHTNIETVLKCGRCDRNICTQCIIQHPVGIRCRECAQLKSLPQYQISRKHLARAFVTGIGMSLFGAFGVKLLLSILPLATLFAPIAFVGFGYLVGEGISHATNHKQGKSLQYIGVGSVFLCAILLGNVIVGNIYGLLALFAGVYICFIRLRGA